MDEVLTKIHDEIVGLLPADVSPEWSARFLAAVDAAPRLNSSLIEAGYAALKENMRARIVAARMAASGAQVDRLVRQVKKVPMSGKRHAMSKLRAHFEMSRDALERVRPLAVRALANQVLDGIVSGGNR